MIAEQNGDRAEAPTAGIASVLLVYPLGGSDLQNPEEFLPRGTKIEERVRALLAHSNLSLSWARGAQHELIIWSEETTVGRLPILGDTLSTILADGPRTIALQPIVSCQQPPQQSDTAAFMPLLKRIAELWHEVTCGLEVLEAWEITSDPSDYLRMVDVYRSDLFPKYLKVVRARRWPRRFMQVAPGTPAMGLASVTFGRDPNIEFLYTPFGKRTRQTSLFRDEVRTDTDGLLAPLMERLEWGAVATALSKSGNGYTPVIGSHPKQTAIAISQALDAWMRRDYTRAASALPATLGGSADTLFLDICQAHEAEPTTRGRNLARWWQLVAADALNRMLVSWWLGLTADYVVSLYTLSDACLSFGISQVDSRVQHRDGAIKQLSDGAAHTVRQVFPEFDGKVSDEPRKMKTLVAFAEIGAAGTWFDSYLPLHWALTKAYDGVRNALVHESINLGRNLIQDLYERQLGVAADRRAVDDLSAIARDVVSGICPDAALVPSLSDRIGFSSRTFAPAIARLAEDVDEVRALWSAAYEAHRGAGARVMKRVVDGVKAQLMAAIERDLPDGGPHLPSIVKALMPPPLAITAKAHNLFRGAEQHTCSTQLVLREVAAHSASISALYTKGDPRRFMPLLEKWLRGGMWTDTIQPYLNTLPREAV